MRKLGQQSSNPTTSNAPFRIFNIGNNRTVKLIGYIQAIEKAAGKEAILDLLPLQPGDVPDTFADSSALEDYVNYKPATSVVDGVKNFVDWYRQYHNI